MVVVSIERVTVDLHPAKPPGAQHRCRIQEVDPRPDYVRELRIDKLLPPNVIGFWTTDHGRIATFPGLGCKPLRNVESLLGYLSHQPDVDADVQQRVNRGLKLSRKDGLGALAVKRSRLSILQVIRRF